MTTNVHFAQRCQRIRESGVDKSCVHEVCAAQRFRSLLFMTIGIITLCLVFAGHLVQRKKIAMD